MTVHAATAVDPAEMAGWPDVYLTGELRRVLREVARLEAWLAELIGEAERRDLARRDGFASTTAWLISVSGDPPAVCRSRVAVAASLQGMPETRAAFSAGAVSECRVRLLAQARALAPEQFAQDEAALVAQAASVSAKRLPQMLAEWRRDTDPPGAEADADRLHSLRALHISPAWSGMVHVDGDLDPEGGAIVLGAIRSLSEPAALDHGDTRTPAQCRADALVEVCRRHQNGEQGSGAGPAHINVTIAWDNLRKSAGVTQTETGPLSAGAVRMLACDAAISRVVLDGNSVPVDIGRARRVVPPAMRRALALRDKGCTHPGCDTPARFCDAHHLAHWVDGGATSLQNPRLLCHGQHMTSPATFELQMPSRAARGVPIG